MVVVLKKDHLALVSLLVILIFTVYFFGINSEQTEVVVNTAKGPLTVMLDAGHGGEDPGAVSDFSKLCEKDINLAIVKKAGEILKGKGVNVLYTREKDVLQYPPNTPGYTAKRKADLTKRKEMIDSSSADFCVSVHLNKIAEKSCKGAQVFYPHNSEESKLLAQSIQSVIKKDVDKENEREALVRGKASDLPIIIFRDIKKPTCVVECGFLSNEEDEKRLADKAYQDKMAKAIADGIMIYWNGN